ncbi:MAG: flagellar hook protein FlgE [Pseudomonadota bacterium]|nr:MAG: flagellar hook protein FlgE [Pseudomonadota bacterium]
MVLRAMYSGASGLRAEGEALGVIGDNIANVNTVGFKTQRVVFEDVLGRSILAGSAAAVPGAGVRVGAIQQLFSQGSLQNTGISTDLALNGDGFFTLHGTVDGVTSNFYTRAGQFIVNSEGYVVNPNGLRVQGYAANPDGSFQTSVSSLRAPTAAIAPHATGEMTVTANLDASATPPALAWNPQDPANTSNFSTSLTVYDSLGNAHPLDIFFVKTGANAWNYYVLASGDEVTPAAPGTNVQVGAGTLQFTTNGELDTITTTTAVSVDFAGATAGQAITLDFGTPLAAGGTGLDGITQFASPSGVSSQNQDGYPSGDFGGVAVDGRGVVLGLYTNGQRIPIGQLAIAKFRANEGLSRAGQNLWVETRESGSAALGVAGSGGRGAVTAGALEGSNVDLAEEFIGLIQHQRSFSANSKTITTADEMLQELISIKR